MAPINKKLKLGVIGMSEGNGHPYSWSAIFNGFNMDFMKDCPFTVIPEYLSKEKYPDNFLGQLAEVTHIWTQEVKISNHISQASKIPFVVSNPEDMIDHIDAVLLARDDAENHLKMAEPFIRAGLPIFIDKPFALSVEDANKMLNMQQYENQIFTCSSLRFAEELMLTKEEFNQMGEIVAFEASVMKKWDTYAIHVLEPALKQIPLRGQFKKLHKFKMNGINQAIIEWDNITGYVKTTGDIFSPLEINFIGRKKTIKKLFSNSFNCFRTSLKYFIDVIDGNEKNICCIETLEFVSIIESGR